MKKVLFVMLTIVMLMSCSKNDEVTPVDEPVIVEKLGVIAIFNATGPSSVDIVLKDDKGRQQDTVNLPKGMYIEYQLPIGNYTLLRYDNYNGIWREPILFTLVEGDWFKVYVDLYK